MKINNNSFKIKNNNKEILNIQLQKMKKMKIYLKYLCKKKLKIILKKRNYNDESIYYLFILIL